MLSAWTYITGLTEHDTEKINPRDKIPHWFINSTDFMIIELKLENIFKYYSK